METAIIASGNEKKIRELSAILERFGFNIKTKKDAGFSHIDPVEDGETYEENSLIKASAIMEASGCTVIADDSGLEVEYLNGDPGIHSARFAGEDCNDDDNIEKLLYLMEGATGEERKAKFVTVITMVFPEGDSGSPLTIVARGECPGHILTERAGTGGFGYDPVFVPDGYDESFAQLGPEVKNRISHRARAIAELSRQLEEIYN